MDSGFIKADSGNLPRVDVFMIGNFFATNTDFCSAEMRNVKTTLSGRESYGDNAIGYVQLKREANICTIKCRICPEHKVRQKPYTVSMVVDEKDSVVKNVQCHDCPAAQGGCKHAVAFLMWVHRRSEEPSCTSTTCYWKKSKLSQVGSSVKFITAAELSGKPSTSNSPKADDSVSESVFQEFVKQGKIKKIGDCQILKYQCDYTVRNGNQFSMHYLSMTYNKQSDVEIFLNEIAQCFTNVNLKYIEKQTRSQHADKLWHHLRFARITASKAYEVSRCKTADGSLIALIMGGRLPDTKALQRGRNLEDSVRVALAKQLGRINKCGLFVCGKHPMLAGSPDGILNNDTVIEIKCPSTEITSKNYICDNKISAKCYAQIQLQMFVTGLKKAVFCVASPKFETNSEMVIKNVEYEENYCNELVVSIIEFWKRVIFPLLITEND